MTAVAIQHISCNLGQDDKTRESCACRLRLFASPFSSSSAAFFTTHVSPSQTGSSRNPSPTPGCNLCKSSRDAALLLHCEPASLSSCPSSSSSSSSPSVVFDIAGNRAIITEQELVCPYPPRPHSSLTTYFWQFNITSATSPFPGALLLAVALVVVCHLVLLPCLARLASPLHFT
ncbi:hypothetical protein IWX90DRAFT_217557 [Phyllosticta citrichinensis]|uniref:Uncharacterized protein n=1 Tax=Phyllosticta citrichinensis TaxID=1130410 RepID=A0ABR1XTS3_9PEZI